MKARSSWPAQRDTTAASRRRAYLAWVEEQIEGYKESVSRAELLELADEVVRDLRISPRGQYQLTELLLSEAVDRRIFKMLKLPGYRGWAASRPTPARDEREPLVEAREPLPLPEAASF